MNEKPVVSVIMLSYNHEKYIDKAITSVLSQRTSFPIEIIVHDDASTDKSAKIINNYATKYQGIIKPIFQIKNQYSQGISTGLIAVRKATGKYIAFCECDDYWCDSNKLQMQVDFMENHHDYSLCVHSGYYAYENGKIKNKLFRAFHNNKTVSTEEIIEKWLFPTASILYRASARNPIEIPFLGNSSSGDYALAVYLSLNGKVMYFDRPMCVYRTQSISSLTLKNVKDSQYSKEVTNRFIELLDRIDLYANKKYHQTTENYKNRLKFHLAVKECNLKYIISAQNRVYIKGNIFLTIIKALLYRYMPNVAQYIILHRH
jgi:glycosyltransferase involved in cell wall biosynthesis